MVELQPNLAAARLAARPRTNLRRIEITIFPYLPLSRRMAVGAWELIPRQLFGPPDAISAEAVEHAHGIAALYRMPGDPRGFGAFVRHREARVGDESDRTQFPTLHDAVVVPLIDQNPSFADPGWEEHPNAGHRMCTTENALLYSHRYGADLHTSYETGTMVTTRHFGPVIGVTVEVIEPPSDLKLPLMRPDLDEVFAESLHDVLRNLAADGPDLPGAISWFELAWANSAIIDVRTRVIALRAGFDALFGSAWTETVRDQLCDLLDPERAPKVHREWNDHRGRHHQEELSDLGWWFQMFSLLRNKIAHGGRLSDRDYVFQEVPHVWHGEWHLRRAIKQIVADHGHPDVLLEDYQRIARMFGELT